MSFLDGVRTRAAAKRRRIVFPEADDPRTQEAVRVLTDMKIVEPVLINGADRARLTRLTVESLMAARAKKGLTEEQAAEFAKQPLMIADAMVRSGEAEACVAGAVHTTAEVLRAALWLVGPGDGVKTVSSAFYMVVPGFRGIDEEVLTFTDCAVIPYPTAEQLADIAIAAAHDRRRIVGDEPRLAFLSFSTLGSAEGTSVTAVREAVQIVRRRLPEVAVDGELQGDAALVSAVGARKAPGSPVAGRR